MAFTTNNAETAVKKGVVKIVVTLSDTAGNSSPMQLPDADDISIQFAVSGTPGTITMQCSNDGVTYAGLPTAVTAAAAGVAAVAQNSQGFLNYRFNLAGGDATTAWTITVVAHFGLNTP